MGFVLRCFCFFLVLAMLILLGRDFYVKPTVSLVAEIPEANVNGVDLYYARYPGEHFSPLRRVTCGVEAGRVAVQLPVETLGGLLLYPRGGVDVKRHGRFANRYNQTSGTFGNPDSVRVYLTGESACKAAHFVRTPGERSIEVVPLASGAVPLQYTVEGCPVFPKKIDWNAFFEAFACSFVAALLITGALLVSFSAHKSPMLSLIYALFSSVALFVPLLPEDGATALNCMWSGDSLYPALLALPIYLFYRKVAQMSWTHPRCQSAKVCSVLFALFYLLGTSYWYGENWDLAFSIQCLQSVKFALTFFGLVCLIENVVRVVFAASVQYTCSVATLHKPMRGIWLQHFLALLQRYPFRTTLLILLVVYIPLFVLEYPCAAGYDISTQLYQYGGAAALKIGGMPLSTHHPIVHTLLIHGCVWVGSVLGVFHVGMALYSVVQLGVFVSAVAFGVHVLVRRGINPAWTACIILYFILHPVILRFMFITAKEVMYAGFLIFFIMGLFSLLQSSKGDIPCSWRNVGCLLFPVMGSVLMRNEGVYVISLSLVVLLFMIKRARRILSACLMVCVVYFVSFPVLVGAVGVQKGSVAEMLSIPIQQLSRVYRERPADVTPREKEKIAQVLVCDDMARLYSPGCSDPVKDAFNPTATGEQLGGFISAWLSVGMRNVDVCMQSFLHNYYLYVYPSKTPNVIYYYDNSGIIRDWQKILTGNDVDTTFFLKKSHLSGLLHYVYNSMIQLPYIQLLWKAAGCTWCLFFLVFLALYHRSLAALSLLVVPCFLWLIPFAGPTNGDFIRYSYPLFVCLPFVVLMMLFVLAKEKSNVNAIDNE